MAVLWLIEFCSFLPGWKRDDLFQPVFFAWISFWLFLIGINSISSLAIASCTDYCCVYWVFCVVSRMTFLFGKNSAEPWNNKDQ